MKAVYTLPVNLTVSIAVPDGTRGITLNNCEVRWGVSDGKLESVILEMRVKPIPAGPGAPIPIDYHGLEDRAFGIASYVANRIRIQMGVDAFDPSRVEDDTNPALFPEPGEEAAFATKRRTFRKSFRSRARIAGSFRPAEYEHGRDHSPAFAHFAEARRSQNPFAQYELCFKVVEHFFPTGTMSGKEWRSKVSNYASISGTAYSEDLIHHLRIVRDRCIHPSNKDHLNPIDPAATRTVREHLRHLWDIAWYMLRHPPPP